MKFLDGLGLKAIKTLGVVVVLILTSAGALLSVQPLIVSINERTAAAAAAEAEKQQIQSDLNRYAALSDFVPQMNATANTLAEKFPEETGTQDFIEQVYDAAEATNIAANQVRGINPSTPVPIAATSGQSGDSICSELETGEFAKIVPDPQQNIKSPDGGAKHFVVCFEEYVEKVDREAFYNAAVNNPARQCDFKLDVKEGTLFYLEVTKCENPNLLPALKEESVTVEEDTTKYPEEAIIGEIASSLQQIGFTILLDPNISISQITTFIENIYRLDRAVSIISVSVGSSGNSGATVVRGFIYSHTKPLTADEFIAQQQSSGGSETDETTNGEEPAEVEE